MCLCGAGTLLTGPWAASDSATSYVVLHPSNGSTSSALVACDGDEGRWSS